MPRRRPKPRPPRSAPAVDRGRRHDPKATLAMGAAVVSVALAMAAWAMWEQSHGRSHSTEDEGAVPPMLLDLSPENLTSWPRQIDRLRMEDRPAEASRVGWAAYQAVPPSDRLEVLHALTLALLTDVPEDQARDALRRRIEANPDDLDARVALVLQEAAPASGLADRPRIGQAGTSVTDRIATLETIAEDHPEHLGTRAALAASYIDAGEIDRARLLLETWPDSRRNDLRYLRLRARLSLDYDHRPDRAAENLRRVLITLPHDWQSRARLAQALEALGRSAEARRQAHRVDRHREILDPLRLGPRLLDDLGRLDDPAALRDLATLCDSVGLDRLAAAWRREAILLDSNADSQTITGPAPSNRNGVRSQPLE